MLTYKADIQEKNSPDFRYKLKNSSIVKQNELSKNMLS
jgi:hypothetical protein